MSKRGVADEKDGVEVEKEAEAEGEIPMRSRYQLLQHSP
jgi:hypothetical protein